VELASLFFLLMLAYSAYTAYAACPAYCAYCAWTLASDFVFVSFAFRCLLLVLRFHRFFVSPSSPCSSLASFRLLFSLFFCLCFCALSSFFMVFTSFFASFFRCFFVVLRCSSFVCFFSLSPSDLVLRSALEDGGLHVDFRLPVVFFLLLRRLRFTSRSLSASTDAGDLVSDIGILSIVVSFAVPPAFIFSSRRVARASSVRDRFQIQCNKGIERASTHAAYLAVSQPS
jgi:hypothetical protein